MTADLVQFLRARLDDDVRVAQAADDASGSPDGEPLTLTADTPAMEAIAEHIARHGPARVLAEVDAKRRILRLHSGATGHSCSVTDETGYWLDYGDVAPGESCTTLRLLAVPYADHPDYREEWKP